MTSRTSTSAPERMWLAHHGPEHAERCCHVRGVAVCRRCSVLYPVALLAALAVVVVDPPAEVLVAAMWLLPAPMALDWAGEHLGRWRYSPRRQVVVTALAAPALGAAFAVHAVEPFSPAAVAPVGFWILVCLGTAMWGVWRTLPAEEPGWEDRHLAEESARRERLDGLLAAADATGRPDAGATGRGTAPT